MSTKRVRKQSKFSRYMRGPIKILARARDFYVQGLTGCAGDAAYINPMGFPATHFATLPRSFSAGSAYSDSSSRDEDMRELIRIASTRSLPEKLEGGSGGGGGVAAMQRSRTVTIGRIDEEKPCEFGGDDDGERAAAYPRSRSYASPASTRSGYLRV